MKKRNKRMINYVAERASKSRNVALTVVEEARLREEAADKDLAHYEVGRSAAACYNMMVGSKVFGNMLELITMACKRGKVSAEEAVADYL